MNNKSIIFIISIVSIFGLFFFDPIPQSLDYHTFADQYSILNIPNFWNVTSNLPFLIVGIYGFVSLKLISEECSKSEIMIYSLLFIGFIATFIGSSYYHLTPNNYTLVWDRIPMTLIFMSFFTCICAELIHPSWYKIGVKVLIPTGILSVIYWYITELCGVGDLRFYVLVQYLPLILIPVILWLYRKHITTFKWLIFILFFYLIAKLLEYFDTEFFIYTKYCVSGHSLKHIFAAMACYFMIRHIVFVKSKL